MPNSNRGAAAAAGPPPPPPPPPVAGPSLTTSVYDTAIGLVNLTWSRAVLGLFLRVDLRLNAGADDGGDVEEELLRFRVRPWLFWKRRGSKRFHLKGHGRHRTVNVAWDLARARFPSAAAPEPSSGYYVTVSVDSDVLLVAGDLVDEAHRRAKSPPLPPHQRPVLVSRREHVVLGDAAARRSYRTVALFGGREREISIELGARGDKDRDAGLSVAVDGERVLHVRRIRWKFRGSEKVLLAAGGRIQISWDLHNWLFQSKDAAAAAVNGATAVSATAASPELGHAVFMFRFEGEERKEGEEHLGKGFSGGGEKKDGNFGKQFFYRGVLGGYFGKNRWNLSESSSGGGGGGERRGRRSRSLRKTSSSSSSNSSASSGSSSTVMDWASPEEVELQEADGFSLLVYAWKSKF